MPRGPVDFLVTITTIAALYTSAALLAAGTELSVRPGPSMISDAERAIEADPSLGVEHAVILVEETEMNEDYGTDVELTYHMRAKILSNEARGLADVEIVLDDREKLTSWWGRTLLPDGTVLEVAERELAQQSLVRAGRWGTRALKAALPGVVPGSVIDYGYTVKGDTRYQYRRGDLQGPWPIRRFRYRWKPSSFFPASYRVHRSEGLDVGISRDRTSVLIDGKNLPPVREEPFMPPDHEVHASAILYYRSQSDSYKDFWNEQAREIDRASRTNFSREVVERALSALEANRGADLSTRLKAAYDWILTNVENPLVEGYEASFKPAQVAKVAEDPLDHLFLAVARALGAEACVVLAPDRRRHFWDPELKAMQQLETRLVAVQAPGQADDQMLLVDPSSGLEFRQLPWWVSGVRGFVATPKGALEIFLPPSDATYNIARTQVELRFSENGSGMQARSTRSARGQLGAELAQGLADLSETERRDRLDEMCGRGPDVEVKVAQSSVGYPGMSGRLICESERSLAENVTSFERYTLDWAGPWVDPPPDLPPGPRQHPVVFDFPHVEILELTLTLPGGFRLAPLPEKTSLVTPYGKYELAFSTAPEGVKVARAFALLPLSVPAEEYEALRRFLEEVRRADRTGLTFEQAGSAS